MDSSHGEVVPFSTPALQDIAEVAGYLWEKGWAERNSGNISVRITGQVPLNGDGSQTRPVFHLDEAYPGLAGEEIYLTGTGCRMRDVARNPLQYGVIIRIDGTGESYQLLTRVKEEEEQVEPTSEITAHLMIQQYLNQNNPKKTAVVHTHPAGLIALSHHPLYKQEDRLNRALWGMLPETLILVPAGIGVVPYQRTGSRELAAVSLKSLCRHQVLLWEKHGCLAVGESAEEAFDLIDILSKSADILLLCLSAGFTPEGLSDDHLAELRRVFLPE